jgi:hypothetical protein
VTSRPLSAAAASWTNTPAPGIGAGSDAAAAKLSAETGCTGTYRPAAASAPASVMLATPRTTGLVGLNEIARPGVDGRTAESSGEAGYMAMCAV